MSNSALAATWNLPSCNPDVDPTAPECNVSAPLNVSTAPQTKTGQLSIQNTLSAEQLFINPGSVGQGVAQINASNNAASDALMISASKLRALSITHSDPTANAVAITAQTAVAALEVTQAGQGEGIHVNSSSTTLGSIRGCQNTSGYCGVLGSSEYGGLFFGPASVGTQAAPVTTQRASSIYSSGGSSTALYIQKQSGGRGIIVEGAQIGVSAESGGVDADTIPIPAGSAVLGTEGVRGTSANSYGVVGYTTSSSGGAGVYGRGVSDYGVLAYSQSAVALYASSENRHGVYGNSDSATLFYGGMFCNRSTNCASLGGPVYTGSFEGRVQIEDSENGQPLLLVRNTAISPVNPGYGIAVRTMANSFLSQTAPEGTAVDAQTNLGNALFAYSKNGIAITAEGAQGGVVGTATNDGTTGVYGSSTSTTTGYGGYFTANGTNASALYAQNTNVFGSGTRYGIQAVANQAQGIALQAQTNAGIAGEFVASNNGRGVVVEAPAAVSGIEVNAAGADTGISLTMDAYDLGINTNGAFIQNSGAYTGGQFYAHDTSGSSNGAFAQQKLRQVTATAIGAGGGTHIPYDILFDGSDIWVLENSSNATHVVYRYNTIDGRLVKTYTVDLNPYTLAQRGEEIWVFGVDGNAQKIGMYDGIVSPLTNLGTAEDFLSATFDGQNFWLGTDANVYMYDPAGTSLTFVSSGAAYDVLYADGFVWASVSGSNQVLKIDSSTRAVLQTIAVGNAPRGLMYDGAYVWVADRNSQTLTRIHTTTHTTKPYPLTTAIGGGSPTDHPYNLAFDGVRIWVVSQSLTGGGVGTFNIANGAEEYLDFSTGGDGWSIAYDGSEMWVGVYHSVSSAGTLGRISRGGGGGKNPPLVSKGVYVYNTTGTLYCVYVSDVGAVRASTTLSNCE